MTTRKFTGIKKVCGETKRLDGWNGHVQVNYATDTDEVWCEYETDDNWWTYYHDDAVISLSYKYPATMKEIKRDIIERLKK